MLFPVPRFVAAAAHGSAIRGNPASAIFGMLSAAVFLRSLAGIFNLA